MGLHTIDVLHCAVMEVLPVFSAHSKHTIDPSESCHINTHNLLGMWSAFNRTSDNRPAAPYLFNNVLSFFLALLCYSIQHYTWRVLINVVIQLLNLKLWNFKWMIGPKWASYIFIKKNLNKKNYIKGIVHP